MAGSLSASDGAFDPLQPCDTVLVFESEIDWFVIGAWVSGYVANAQASSSNVTLANMATLVSSLQVKCYENPGTQFIKLVDGVANPTSEGDDTGREDAVRAFLLQFFEPDADHAALTAALKPSPEDIRAVYAEPLARQLVINYDALYQPGIAIRPKADHKELITFYTTTAALQSGDPMLAEFPGGYKKLLPHFVSDVPIVRFKFVKPGETLGLAFDGLIYVNDHWVFMPKPWRSLE